MVCYFQCAALSARVSATTNTDKGRIKSEKPSSKMTRTNSVELSYVQKIDFENIYYNYQWLVLTLMALSEKKTSVIKLGRLSSFSVECLRVLRDGLGVVF